MNGLIDLKVKSSCWSQSSPTAIQLFSCAYCLYVSTCIVYFVTPTERNLNILTERNGDRMNNCSHLHLILEWLQLFFLSPWSLLLCTYQFMWLCIYETNIVGKLFVSYICLRSLTGFILTF